MSLLQASVVVDDVVVGRNTRLEGQLSRINCQMFWTELSSGHLAGNATIELASQVPTGLIHQLYSVADVSGAASAACAPALRSLVKRKFSSKIVMAVYATSHSEHFVDHSLLGRPSAFQQAVEH